MQSAAAGYANARIAVNLRSFGAFIGWPPAALMDTGTAGAIATTRIAAATHPRAIGGASSISYADDWYDRVHVIPSRLDLGNLVSVQQRTVTVWNAWRAQSLTLTALQMDGADGIAATGPGALPLAFTPLQERSWQVAIGENGPANIDATLTWVFAGQPDVALVITGQRLTAWLTMPDWSGGIMETLAWLTEIEQAWTGQQDRTPCRQAPRRDWEFAVVFAGTERQLAETMLFGWRARNWALPVWPDQSVLATALAAGSMTIPVGTAGLDFAVGETALLRLAFDQYELVEVSDIAADSITLSLPTAQDWPAGTLIYPCRVARLTDTPNLTRKSSNVLTTTLRFEAKEECDWPAVAPSSTYLGFPVLEDRIEESDDPAASYDRLLDITDNSTGIPVDDDRTGLGWLKQSHAWLLYGRSARAAHRSLLYWLQGRAAALWVPSWSDDLTLAALVPSNVTVLNVAACGVSLYLAGQASRKHIRIELYDGTVFYRAAFAAADVGGGIEQLQIDTALGQNVDPSQVRQISWLALATLASDSVQIQHDTDSEGVARCAVNFAGVPADEPA